MGVRLLKGTVLVILIEPCVQPSCCCCCWQDKFVHLLRCCCWQDKFVVYMCFVAAGCWLERLTRNTLSLVVEQLPDFKFCASPTHLVNLILCSFSDPPLSQVQINVKPESLTHPYTNHDGNKHLNRLTLKASMSSMHDL
jgi:hypothetical protein